MATLTYVSSAHGDWCGIYIDNKLQVEGHSIPPHEWLELIEKWNIGRTKQFEVCGDWLEEYGSFLKNLSDIPSEKLT